MTEKQIEKIKKTIRSHRSKLSAEKRKFGWYDDSGGRRYVIAELYMKIGDYKGAINYFNWFDKEFSEDIGYPDFNLYKAAAYFENKKMDKAARETFYTLFSNVFLIEMICKNPVDHIKYKGYSNLQTKEFAEYTLKTCLTVLSEDFKTWLCEFICKEEYQNVLKEYVALNKLISDESAGATRNNLLNQQRLFVSKWAGR